jgi:hypothetical protein
LLRNPIGSGYYWIATDKRIPKKKIMTIQSDFSLKIECESK